MHLNEKGFSALGLFLLGIALLAIMSYAGLFNIPKSAVNDTTKYQVSGSKQIKGKGILMTNLELTTPTPTTQPTSAPQPTLPPPTIGPTATPAPTRPPTPTSTPGPSPTPFPTQPPVTPTPILQ